MDVTCGIRIQCGNSGSYIMGLGAVTGKAEIKDDIRFMLGGLSKVARNTGHLFV